MMPPDGDRRAALGVLNKATADELRQALDSLGGEPAVSDLRPPEIGLVMVRGRIGGDGAPFNLGEATVTRSAVSLATGEIGHGHVLGRDPERARLVAILDALLQSPGFPAGTKQATLAPIRERLETERATRAAQTAATRVDFFTLVRGDD